MDESEEIAQLHRLRAERELLDAAVAGDSLRKQKELRQRYADDLVRAAFLLQELRQRAIGRFSESARMWFDRTGLEQATSEPVALHKAKRFEGRHGVVDLCCGIGSDSIALARMNCPVQSVDKRQSQCLRTNWNAEAYGVHESIETSCQDALDVSLSNVFVHVDPDRRQSSSKRAHRIDDYSPSAAQLRQIISRANGGAIKVSPASNFAAEFSDCERELISWKGECKEAAIWFGELRRSTRSATVLPSGETLSSDEQQSGYVSSSPVLRYLFDPDPAVVRSHLVNDLALQQGLKRLDESEEYLTGDEMVATGFASCYEVIDELPNNERALRRAVRGLNWGEVIVKSRHLSISPESVRRKLTLNGTLVGVVVYCRIGGKSRIVLSRRIDSGTSSH